MRVEALAAAGGPLHGLFLTTILPQQEAAAVVAAFF
jgi:hypothetical protein